MPFLLLRVLCNIAFSQLLKLAQVRDGQMLPAALINYSVAAALSGAGLLFWGAPAPHPASLWLGGLTGLTYAISLLGIESMMRLSGVSITVAVLQLSVVIPTVFAMVWFRERPNGWQSLGIALAIAALPLFSNARAGNGQNVPLRRIIVSTLFLFIVTGCSGVFMKAFHHYAPERDLPVYTFLLFGVATAVVGVAVAARRTPRGPSALPLGSIVGVANLTQLIATMHALAVLPAVVVFPVTSALAVALNTLLSVRLWNERLDHRARAGIALAILATILLNMTR